MFQPIIDAVPAAYKYDAYFKSGQFWLRNNYFALLV